MAIVEQMTDKKILHETDCYKNALLDYNYAKYRMASSNGAGFDTKVAELKQFFRPKAKAK